MCGRGGWRVEGVGMDKLGRNNINFNIVWVLVYEIEEEDNVIWLYL